MEPKPEVKSEDKPARHNNDRNKHKKNKKSKINITATNFKGNCPELAGYTYDLVSSARADQFVKTTEQIAEFLKKDAEFPNDLAKCIMTKEEPDTDSWMPKPRTLTDAQRQEENENPELKKMMEQIMGEKVKEWMLRRRKFVKNKCRAFTLVYGQCSAALKTKLKGQDGWEDAKNDSDLVKLLKLIKLLMINHQDTCYPTLSAFVTVLTLLKLYQFRHETLEDYRTKFEAAVEVVKHVGVDLPKALTRLTDESLKADKLSRDTTTQEQISEAESKTYDRFLAVMFIKGADKGRYESIMTHYENMYSNGTNQYPANVTEAYNRLLNWKRDNKVNDTPHNDGVAFAQGTASADDEKRPEQDRSGDTCHACGKKGHHAWERKCKASDLIAKAETLHAMVHDHDSKSDYNSDSSDRQDADGEDEVQEGEDTDDGREDGVCITISADAKGTTEPEPMEAYEFAFCTATEPIQDVNIGYIHSQDGGIKKDIQTNSFNEGRASVIPKGSVGLDSMSSVDLFGDKHLLSDIETVSDYIRIVCNAGTVMVTQMGTFRGYGRVWYHPGAIANILSLSNVQSTFHITYDSHLGNQFVVHRKDGTKRIFRPTEKGLYASNVVGTKRAAALVTTVKENSESYTKRELKRAEQARRLMRVVGRPSERQMIDIVNRRLIPNCNVNEQDIINARHIFGPDIGSLKGKTTRRKEPHVEFTLRLIPEDVMRRHREVTVCFDVMYVNNITFLVSISRALKFCTAEGLANRRADTLLIGMSRIKAAYSSRGFIFNRAMGDNEFETLKPGLADMGVTLNVVSRGEHVPEIERHIRTIKERCRAIYNTLPFTRMPARMLSELVYNVTFWLNAFPALDGISTTISPRELVTGIRLDGMKHCVLPFGAYVQTHEEHDNTMATRTIGAIALRPTGNVQGAHFFMSLQSGRRLVRNRWTEIPMPADVIARVKAMAGSAAYNRLVFGDSENAETHEVIESDDDASNSDSESDEDEWSSDSGDNDDSNSDDDAPQDQQGIDAEDAAETDYGNTVEGDDDIMLGPTSVKPEPIEATGEDVRVHFAAEDEVIDPQQTEGGGVHTRVKHEPIENKPEADESAAHSIQDHSDSLENGTGNTNSQNENNAGIGPTDPDPVGPHDSQTDQRTLASEMDERYGARSGQHGLRPRRKPHINYRAPRRAAGVQIHEQLEASLAQIDISAVAPSFNPCNLADISPALEPLIGTILTQYGVSRGLKMFGTNGEDAVIKELRQLHDREVMGPKSGESLTKSDRRAALNYLMFLKKRRNGSIKGRGCADGRKQRAYITKEEASSPTISTEAVFLIITIGAKERRDVATVDIPGAFMQTDLDGEKVLIKFQGKMAEMLAMIEPNLYRQHIMIEKGRPVLYAELKKVLYGMLQAALKFWQQITSDLVSLGYSINPYDWCVANKLVNGKQHTIGWHVDDFIMTHEDASVNTELINWFQKKYGELSPLTVHRGRTHDYLGMNLDFTVRGSVTVSMRAYVNDIIDQAPTEWDDTATTPAANHLFQVNGESPKLDPDKAALYHHIVAKALFLCKRARPDLQLAVGFLCTRVKGPDQDDWNKLRRLIQYLRGTALLDLTLRANGNNIVKWWIDAAYAVHTDFKSHTGATMSLGSGMVYSSSTRQKINTKSSTEAELVGAGDLMPQVLWTRYFLDAQGYSMSGNVVYQDNRSAMLLEQNGKGSSSKRTRHINIRFFFITDRIQAGEVEVKHCPTDEMVGDFFTKPLQGMKFKRFRDIILNVENDQQDSNSN